jgi:phage replication-related protein YjqB (UPF0714/DUF867 family)
MDKYANFKALKSEQLEDQDFRIRTALHEDAKIAVIAPHGGAIEPGTSELAIAIAGSDLSFAVFEGIKAQKNRDLHITSTNFDEPRCVNIVAQSLAALAIHGEANQGQVAYIGGRDKELCKHVGKSLKDAGFDVQVHQDAALQGTSPANICNRGTSGCGVQLELSRGLRATFFESRDSKGRDRQTQEFHKFVEAVRLGLVSAGAL